MRRAPSLIAGGGPAGAAAAIVLARSGIKPLVIERHQTTGNALCGGFLSWRTLETLHQLGLSPNELGGHTITHVRLFSSKRMGEVALPRPARGVSRHRLDGILLTHAEHCGAIVKRGVSVRCATPEKVELAGGDVIKCTSLFLATGKHDCRGLTRPKRGGGDPMLGLRLRIPSAPGLAQLLWGVIELHLFRGGYVGILLQEDGCANLCMAVRKSRLSEADGSPAALLEHLAHESPHLGDRLAYAAPRTEIDAIAGIPYGWRETSGATGLYRLGDQAAVIPSFAGEGIGIALASGIMAAKWQLGGGAVAATRFQTELAHVTERPVRLSAWLNVSVQNPIGRVAAPMMLGIFPWLGTLMAEATRIRSCSMTGNACDDSDS